ncbi:hypothetical protein LOD99_10388 [Oopsacas minuta]|uniref:Uncharacterized protein n=1 Tax=Oopsacas minuta TaxID=111878 RepID=A0AAV7KKW5_9METZ|nr:hypothetical protein LOD99_10388 [Oopsacas minuta]
MKSESYGDEFVTSGTWSSVNILTPDEVFETSTTFGESEICISWECTEEVAPASGGWELLVGCTSIANSLSLMLLLALFDMLNANKVCCNSGASPFCADIQFRPENQNVCRC